MRAGLVAVALLTACGGPMVTHGQRDPLRDARAANGPDEVFGETVSVTVGLDRFLGELIDCDGANLYVRLHVTGPAWMRIPWRPSTTVEITLGGSGPGFLVWTLLGILSSLSHGYYAGLTSTVWGTVGSLTTSFTWNPREPVATCEALHRFARFPQGMPPGFAVRFGPDVENEAPPAPAPPGGASPAPWSPP